MQQDSGNTDQASAGWAAVTETFGDHARRNPHALAVETQGHRRSYAEMAARIDFFAARLADRLSRLPRRSDNDLLIGVCLARDVDLPAWLFAILKIGGAYLPIDPSAPPARVAHMLEDAQPALIVASRRYETVVTGAIVPVMIAEDEPAAPLAAVSAVKIRPDMLAYVIFTSGSTGRPKGVEIEHRSLAALMATMAISPGMAEGERMLGLTRISFDLSVPDMFLPFFVGGSLTLVEVADAADPLRLADAFDAYRPRLAQATPSTWRALVESGWRGQSSLRIVTGGEALTRALADALLVRCSELWNIYGPTETTVWSTACRVEPGDGPVPIGWPMTGYRVHLADAGGAAVPVGQVGEIRIGGVGVARGYRNRPDLTAERFLTEPGGARIYRTGDLGRIDAQGALFCLGRLDDQVKVRGFRIELGDVEAALALHPGVAWVAARLWNDPSGEPTLVAYIVPRPGPPPSSRDLRSFLSSQIPPYMIPDRVIALTAMPLTPNGKVDRASLPNPFASVTHTSPGDANEGIAARLAAIWIELLGVASVSARDDFFDLGGYSLMTVRLGRRIDKEFGVKLALIELLRHSTLDAMAARIDEGNVATDPHAMLLNAGGSRPPLFWLDAGPLMRTMTRSLSADQPAYALNLDPAEEDAMGAGDLSIIDIARSLKSKLVEQRPEGPYYLGGWCRWGVVAFELARQLRNDGHDVGLLVLLDADRPGFASRPRVLRSRLSRWLRAPRSIAPTEPASFSQRVETATHRFRLRPYGGDVVLIRPVGSIGDAGWKSVLQGSLSIELTPGDHVSMVRGEAVTVLATTLDGALLDAQKRYRQTARAQIQAAARLVS